MDEFVFEKISLQETNARNKKKAKRNKNRANVYMQIEFNKEKTINEN